MQYEEASYPHVLEQVLGITDTGVQKESSKKSQNDIRGNDLDGKWHLAKNRTMANWTISSK